MIFKTLKIISLLLAIIISGYVHASANTKSDKWLLVTGINYNKLETQDKQLVDSILPLYHQAKNDTTKMSLLNSLVESFTNDNVWPLYNDLLYSISLKNNTPTYLKYRVLALNNIGVIADMKGNYSQAIIYYKKALSIQKSIGYNNITGRILNNAASSFENIGNIKTAINYYEDAIKILKQRNDSNYLLITKTNLASAYENKGDITKAIANGKDALKIAIQINNESGEAYISNFMGTLYTHILEYDKAINYCLKAIVISKKINNQKEYINSLYGMGICHFYKQEYDQALGYYLRAFKLNKETQDQFSEINIATELGNIYSSHYKNYEEALYYYTNAIQLCHQSENNKALSKLYYYLGELYVAQYNNSKAEYFLKQALTIAQKLGHPKNIMKTAALLVNIYKQKKEFANAFLLKELYEQMQDSILNEKNSSAIIEMQYKYQYAIQQQTDSIKYSIEKKAQAEKLKKENTIKYILLLIVFLLFSFAIILYNRYKLIQKQKSIIDEQKKQIEIQKEHETFVLEQKLLRSQMNPHFIFNSLDVIRNLIYTKQTADAELYLSKLVMLTRQILDNSRHEYVSLENEIATLENYLTLQQLLFTQKFVYSLVIDPSIDTEALLIPPMLAQPFIENALKHGIQYKQGQGKIEVKFYLQNQKLLFEVIDNGIGLERAQELKQTQTNKHQSLATTITLERLQNLNKDRKEKIHLVIVDIENELNEIVGVKLSFEIPYIYNY